MSDPLTAAIERHLPEDGEDFAFALSGGLDSLALLTHLADHPRLKAVFHVDHGLRQASRAEAYAVGHMAKRLGHTLEILRWSPGELSSAIQEKARRARYGLMGAACRAAGLSQLVTAHHADDQAETVLMRVKRGSGWRGAAGMHARHYAPVWPELAGVTLIRPALDVSRDELHGRLQGVDPISDPSNRDRRHERVRVREYLKANLDLRKDMLELAAEMQRGREAERSHLREALAGYHLTHEGLFTLQRLVGPSTLATLAPIIGGQNGPADRTRIRARYEDLQIGKRLSLGCGTLAQWDGYQLTMSRDPVAMTGRSDGKLQPTAVRMDVGPSPKVWDGRFIMQGEGGIIQPERRGHHVGYRILYGRDVRVENLVERRLQAALTGM